MITAHGVPIAVSSRTNEVIADWTFHSKEPKKTNAVATAAAITVAFVRVALGTMASRSRPME
ncbi:hypothetical protein VR44_08180 [Streptomyces katrae]|uniref:Uncharacterized protein n=1 Tax=Streptomyces katrae TaxID=68223 RepID=A0A0F4JPL8_9ACTN|nr:hypothetical protein VR44_08180 [Streptomyces katrae]